jgi:putative tryptophan/tyrosine transport system substrate-binding protein
VIFAAGGSDPGRAAKAATTTIPIVFESAADPIAAGLVASLNRPGGNVTGVSLMGSALEAKRLELLHELAPKASAIAALVNPNYPAAKSQSEEFQAAAAHLGVKPIILTATRTPARCPKKWPPVRFSSSPLPVGPGSGERAWAGILSDTSWI